MSDYPMLISNKLHSFRNFSLQRYEELRIYVQKNFHIEKKDEKCIDRYFAKTKNYKA